MIFIEKVKIPRTARRHCDKIYHVGDKQNRYLADAMYTKNKKITYDTSDKLIRAALKNKLQELYKHDPMLRVIEEFGVNHGSVRADIAVVNGIMHGYEIKSDRDTLNRLSEQVKAYNSVFDKVTIVVGFSHIYKVMEMIPDWWGVDIAKPDGGGAIVFSQIRKPQFNRNRDRMAIARLLWRGEALCLLKEADEARGYYSKPRGIIYEHLASVLETNELSDKVREILCLRTAWRSV